MKVMVTGAGALLGQGVIRSLRASSLEAQIVAVDPSPLSAGLYWADRAHLVPLAKDPAYLDAVRAIIRLERPDALLVGTDVELEVLSRARTDIEREDGAKVLVSSPEVVAVADDKWLTAEFLRARGFPYPYSCLPGGERELIGRVGFPLVVKPRIGARSVGVHVVADEAGLARAVADVGNPVIQECIATADEEYTAGVIVCDGSSRASIVMRRDLRDGNTYRAWTSAFPELNSFVRSVADTLQPHGPVNFQFRLGSRGPTIFEINARFSGTTPLRAHAGFNEVEMLLRWLVDGKPVEQPVVRDVVILRHWSETVVEPGAIDTMQGGVSRG
jgi:carbamoyl-phosphate synthase large subunit